MFLPQTGLGCFHGYNSVRNKEQLNVEKTGDNLSPETATELEFGFALFFQERAEVGPQMILAVDH